MRNDNGHEGGAGEPVELMIFVDSNQRHVKWDLFWRTTGKRRKESTGSLLDVEHIVRNNAEISTAQYVAVLVGVNITIHQQFSSIVQTDNPI